MLRVKSAGSASSRRANMAPRSSRMPRLAAHDMPYWATKPARPRTKVRPMTAQRHASRAAPRRAGSRCRAAISAATGSPARSPRRPPRRRTRCTKPRRLFAKNGAMRREALAQRRRGRGHGAALSAAAAGAGGCLQSPRSTQRRMPAPTLSVILITKNESAHIDACLASVAFADEWIVVDSRQQRRHRGSGRVPRRARWSRPTTGPASARRSSARSTLASGRWVLAIDADERVTPELAANIRRADRCATTAPAAYELSRLSSFCGRWIRHGDWYPDRVLRLFRRGAGALFAATGSTNA